MSTAIKTIVVLDAGVGSSEVARALPGGSGIEISAIIDGLEEARMRLLETVGELVVIVARSQSESVLDLIEYSVNATPGRPVVVLGYSIGEGFTKRAFAAGADDLIALPAQPEHVVFALQKAMARKVTGGELADADRAPLICVLGPKGGTGKTLTTTSLAIALAESGKRVAIVDLDLQFGDIGLTMAVAPERTIYDLVKAGGSLDTDKLEDFLMTHSSGVKLLLAPSRPDHAVVVTVEILREILTVLRRMVDYVIVDTPPGFTPEVIATIDAATSVIIVSMLDALSLKNTKLGLETLELMGFPSQHVKLVLNRARSRVGISEGEVVTVMGRVPDVMVPSDRDIPLSLNEGTSILISKPQSEAAQAFRALARSYTGDVAVTPLQAKRKSLFSRRKTTTPTEIAAPPKRETVAPAPPVVAAVETVAPAPTARPKRKSLIARYVRKHDDSAVVDGVDVPVEEPVDQPDLAAASDLWPLAELEPLAVPQELRVDPLPVAEADPVPMPPAYTNGAVGSDLDDDESPALEPDSYVRSNGDSPRRPFDSWED